MTVRIAEKCALYCGESEPGYIMCCRDRREMKVYRSICESACPYYKEK